MPLPNDFVAGGTIRAADHNAIKDEVAANAAAIGTIVPPATGIEATDTAAIQAAIDATPVGGTLVIPDGDYLFSRLTFTKSINVEGAGWKNVVNAALGNAAWTDPANVGGTVLRSTATTGSALNFSSTVTIAALRLKDVLVIGPGSGTSSGVQIGNASPSAGAKIRVDNVMVANFSVGWDLRFILDCTFIDARSRGCSTGFKLTDTTNQNVFINTEVQFSTVDGIYLNLSSNNVFVGGLLQNISGTSGVRITNNDCNVFEGFWAEGVTAPWVVDIVGGTRNKLAAWHMSSNIADAVRVGGNATRLQDLQINKPAALVSVLSTAHYNIIENVSGTIDDQSGSEATVIINPPMRAVRHAASTLAGGVPSSGVWAATGTSTLQAFVPVPADYASGDLVIKIARRATSATGTAVMRRDVYRFRDAMALNTVSTGTNVDFAPGDTNTHMLAVTVAAASFAVGDIIRLDLRRLGDDAGDTTGSTAFDGLWAEYTAKVL